MRKPSSVKSDKLSGLPTSRKLSEQVLSNFTTATVLTVPSVLNTVPVKENRRDTFKAYSTMIGGFLYMSVSVRYMP